MKRGVSGLRRMVALGALSAGSSLLIAVGLNAWQDLAYQRARESTSDRRAVVTRSWRPTAEHFNPPQMLLRQPVVRDYQLVTVAEASKHIDDEELILGVVVNGESRAYPINIMTGPSREILNDELGGRPIAATW